MTQGQTRGRVGITGLATRPHLHFEFHVRGPSGERTAVPAPGVVDTTLIAAPGFAGRVQSYGDRLAVASHANYLFLKKFSFSKVL